MLVVIPHIEYLLRQNDCVILPGFGALVVHYMPSCVSELGTLMPPSRSVGFNPLLNVNDGLLANSIMRRSRVSYDRAVRTIADNVKELRELLDSQDKVQFGKLGVFYKNREGAVCFEPDAVSCALMSDFYGLFNLNLPTLEQLRNPQQNAESKKKEPVILHLGRSVFKYAAAIAVAVVLTFTLSTPIVVDQTVDYAGMKAKLKQPQVEVVVPKSEPVEARVQQPVSVSGENIDNVNAVEEIAESGKRYYVVVASLRTLEQAHQFIEESSIPGLKILDNKKNVYRVYANSGESYREVYNSDYAKLKKTNPDIWIYKEIN